MSIDFDIAKITGLSQETAEKRLKEEGFNELPSTKTKSFFHIVREVVQEPMFLLLVFCGGVYLLLGDITEALMLLGFVFLVMGITIYQERKTERALEALRDLSSPRASVVRDGKQKRIAGREVVREDIILLAEGDRIPADATLLHCVNLTVDESLLTGESVPVRKISWDGNLKQDKPGGDDLPFVYSGTLAVGGQGVAKVWGTGVKTEMGKIGKALQAVEPEETLLQKETGKLVKTLAIWGLSLCVIVVVVYGFTRGDWLHGFLAGITLAMATLPEEFPVVLTIFLALGAWRISHHQVLTRRVPVVETLGSATVLCTDKTGTLTWNRMNVGGIRVGEEIYMEEDNKDKNNIKKEFPEKFHDIVEFSVLASQRDPFDPMEIAFKEFCQKHLANTEHIHNDWILVREYPLSPELLAISHVWKSPDGGDYVIASKGAPEAVADLCHFDEKQKEKMLKKVQELAGKGLRVLAVARSYFKQETLPEIQHDFKFEYMGLLGLSDPIRPTVPPALKECYSAGIRVIMITGDYPDTARHIARQIGLSPCDEVITGYELDDMSDEELQKRIKNVNVFARVVPQQKLRLVNALKTVGEIVAMTGDGVNDAPALKSAHIGIAMGGRGTDVAREASSLVLLDDDFSSIVSAVRMGRRIFDNIKKAMAYILAIHVPIAGMSLIPVIFKLPPVLLPVHVVFLEMIIDPACSVVFEAEKEEEDIMNRPPRDPAEPLFSRKTILLSVLQGVSVLLAVLGVFCYSLTRVGYSTFNSQDAPTLAFTTLIISNLGLIVTNRSWTLNIPTMLRRPNNAFWWIIGGTLVFLMMILYIPFLQNLFRFTTLHPMDLLLCLGSGSAGILWFELLKLFKKNKKNHK